MTRGSPSPNDRILQATMDLAGELGWARVSLAAIAERSGLTLPEVLKHLPGKGAILAELSDRVNQAMIHGAVDTAEPVRDRLFEVMMRRFDALKPYRAGVAALLAADPLTIACGLRRFRRSMALTMETAGLSSSGLSGCLRVQGAAAVYLYALRRWVEDDSPDLSATMAALDKALGRADALARLFTPQRPQNLNDVQSGGS